jgi:hypothetical protein
VEAVDGAVIGGRIARRLGDRCSGGFAEEDPKLGLAEAGFPDRQVGARDPVSEEQIAVPDRRPARKRLGMAL